MLSNTSLNLMMTGNSNSQKANLTEKYITSSEYRHVRIKTNTVFNGFVQMHQFLTTQTLENEWYQILMKLDVSKLHYFLTLFKVCLIVICSNSVRLC